MIKILNKISELPYKDFYKYYDLAAKSNQPSIQAFVLSSFDITNSEVDSRYVNLKYIDKDKWFFFTNYDSPKSKQITSHNQISGILFWESINIQIRLKAKISKSLKEISDLHYNERSIKKNALARSSNQSKKIKGYNSVVEKYNRELVENTIQKKHRPENWGGFNFTPYYFEFWKGHESRINKREVFDKIDGAWKQSFLQP